jgi:predicted small secreted protein
MFRFVTKSSFIIGVLIGVFLAVLVKVSIRRPKTDSEPIPSRGGTNQYFSIIGTSYLTQPISVPWNCLKIPVTK